ncbi:uncharacterized protein TNCV_3166311 [Trichonephila clavipes]|uniref:Uncharacterized protein n=1 Tax=Trichonephila clavipes TaxID=2585209 RepID=A0A8X6R9W0_TRICX|nr:uncharacterized protein TNCV_3166311 [Trichonephila clavipes]
MCFCKVPGNCLWKIATSTSARIVERVTVGSTSACRTILRSSLLVAFLVAPHPVFRAWVPSRVHCSQQFPTAHSELSTWQATRRVDQPAVFISMIRPLSNSRNCEKCLLARLPGMFRLPKFSYNQRVIVTFMNLRICTGLYSTLFLIVAPPRRDVSSNPGKEIDVCKSIMPLRYEDTLSSCRNTSPHKRFVENGREVGYNRPPPGCSHFKAFEPNHTVTCMVLNATDND